MNILSSIKRQIPNCVTLCNLTCGVLAAANAAQGALTNAALFICLGILFDFFDGLAARALRVSSPLGKELDSLADVVTSGVAPALILYRILDSYYSIHGQDSFLPFLALLMPAFSAYRLAKFNLDTRQTHSFLGLPVPCNALFWAALGICAERYGQIQEWHSFESLWFNRLSVIDIEGFSLILTWPQWAIPALIALSLITNLAMISEIPMFALKFKSLRWTDNKLRFIFLASSAALLVLFGPIGLAAVVLYYIILSILTQKKPAHE